MTSTTGFLAHYDDLQMDLGFQIQTQLGKSQSDVFQSLFLYSMTFNDLIFSNSMTFRVCAMHRGRLYHFLWRSLV